MASIVLSARARLGRCGHIHALPPRPSPRTTRIRPRIQPIADADKNSESGCFETIRTRVCRGEHMTLVINSELAANPQHSRASIMAAVAAVLRDSGASITNIESAIARAGVSAQEISASFGGNRELLLAMVSQLSDAMSTPLAASSTQPDVRQRLLEFGQCVTKHYAASHLRGVYRIAITESIRHTGLGCDFYEVGPGRLMQRLAEFLQIAQADGALRRADPHLLASHFLSLLRANLDVADSFPHDPANEAVAGDAYVRNAVELFCRGLKGGRRVQPA